jgi:hypothetical protein
MFLVIFKGDGKSSYHDFTGGNIPLIRFIRECFDGRPWWLTTDEYEHEDSGYGFTGAKLHARNAEFAVWNFEPSPEDLAMLEKWFPGTESVVIGK